MSSGPDSSWVDRRSHHLDRRVVRAWWSGGVVLAPPSLLAVMGSPKGLAAAAPGGSRTTPPPHQARDSMERGVIAPRTVGDIPVVHARMILAASRRPEIEIVTSNSALEAHVLLPLERHQPRSRWDRPRAQSPDRISWSVSGVSISARSWSNAEASEVGVSPVLGRSGRSYLNLSQLRPSRGTTDWSEQARLWNHLAHGEPRLHRSQLPTACSAATDGK